MDINNVSKWFFEEPIDFESKKYRLLSCVLAAEKMLESGDIDKAMQYIEDHLVCFYKFQTEKEICSFDEREIVGIDPILMDLIYKSGKKDQGKDIEILSDIAELGILEFEALHSIFRIKWRDIDDALKISYLGDKPVLVTGGFAFLSNEEEGWTRFYTFENPEHCGDWTEFGFNFSDRYDYDYNKIIEFASTLRDSGSKTVLLNCHIGKGFSSEEAIDFFLSCKV